MARAQLLLASAAALSACISSDSVECADGRVCPAGMICHRIELPPAEVVCASPEEVHLCDGLPDFARCGDGGRCYSGACLPGGCGNGRRDLADPLAEGDAAEACDDGNASPGDGCSADCRSDETCRNGVLDAVGGEQCDDANALSHDGCSSTCVAEPAAWTPVERIEIGLAGYAMAYDARRERVLFFGGANPYAIVPVPRDDTLEWDGWRWRLLATAIAPSARTGAAMAYDAARDRAVLFGGLGSALLGDTWEWDGEAWTVKSPASAPTPRTGAAMAYDPIRRRVVLFGGFRTAAGSADEPLDDTWAWDGADWTPLPGAAPAPRRGSAMAFDAGRGAVVLFGGADQDELFGDTWALDGAGWRELSPASPPAPRRDHAMATDPETGAAVVLGGSEDLALPASTAGAWRLGAAAWAPLPGTPPILDGHALAPLPPRGALVTVSIGGETFEWAAGSWSLRDVHGALRPPPMRGHAAVLDPFEQRVVVFGGQASGALGADTWLWDGQWRLVVGTSPPARRDAGAAFDTLRRRVVLFGGMGGGAPALLGDTWIFDGAAWSPGPAGGPTARLGPAAAFDAARGRVVLFGGRDAGVPLADTWTWDGAQWAAIASGPQPPARSHAVLAYDARRREVVMFGGVGPSSALGDTWIWDGAAWREATSNPSPPARREAGMAFDPARGRIILYGGDSGTSPLSDAWEWDGAAWHPIPISIGIAGRVAHSLVSSPRGDGVLAFGGSLIDGGGQSLLDEHLQLGRGTTASEDRCVRRDTDGDGLAACADPDCWARCAPACPPGADPAAPECASAPRCGDGSCGALESCSLCPADCGACPASCGDHACDAGETAAACPGDCAAGP